MNRSASLPESCSVAFKEWAGICSALASGWQALILRKGGIAEGTAGFAPEHPAFWLYPTRLHEAQQGLREPITTPEPPPSGLLDLQALAVVTELHHLIDPEAIPRLAPLHVWSDETVQQRFQYKRPGLWVLGVRVYRLPNAHRIEDDPAFSGCKSWVPLTTRLPTLGGVPVLDDSRFDEQMERLRTALADDPSNPQKVQS